MMKTAVIILEVMLAYAAVYSLMCIITPEVMMASSLNAATGKTTDNARADGYLKDLVVDQINAGTFAFATVISGVFVLFAGFRKVQRWAWYAFLVVGGIAWLRGLIISIAIADRMNLLFQIIGMVIFLVGLLIPVRAFFAKAAEKPAEA